jgi:hypothetical protein
VGRLKLPKAEQGPRLQYLPFPEETAQNTLHPAFCFRYMQRAYGIDDFQKNQKSVILGKLTTLGKMTWAQIQQSNRQTNGCEIIPQLQGRIPIEFKDRYPDTKVLGFYCGKDGRMYGVRRSKLFYILWFDWSPFKLIDH